MRYGLGTAQIVTYGVYYQLLTATDSHGEAILKLPHSIAVMVRLLSPTTQPPWVAVSHIDASPYMPINYSNMVMHTYMLQLITIATSISKYGGKQDYKNPSVVRGKSSVLEEKIEEQNSKEIVCNDRHAEGPAGSWPCLPSASPGGRMSRRSVSVAKGKCHIMRVAALSRPLVQLCSTGQLFTEYCP